MEMGAGQMDGGGRERVATSYDRDEFCFGENEGMVRDMKNKC